MESLLSTAFDNIASTDTGKIRRGLRQLDGLLVQICFSQQTLSPALCSPRSPAKMVAPSTPRRIADNPKPLGELSDDRAYQQFYRLQQSFEWNVATKLVECLGRLLGRVNGTVTDSLITATLENILGSLLLHTPSKSLFGREINMNLLIDLLDPTNRPHVILATIDVIMASMLDRPQTVRLFEEAEGLHTMASLYQSNNVSSEIKARVEEILEVYLMPETLSEAVAEEQAFPRTPSPFKADRPLSFSTCPSTKTTVEKREFLSNYLGGGPLAPPQPLRS